MTPTHALCDCAPLIVDVDENGVPEWSDHEADCPRGYDHLQTAADIASFRQYIMVWAEGDHRRIVAKMARGVTARAVELELERP